MGKYVKLLHNLVRIYTIRHQMVMNSGVMVEIVSKNIKDQKGINFYFGFKVIYRQGKLSHYFSSKKVVAFNESTPDSYKGL